MELFYEMKSNLCNVFMLKCVSNTIMFVIERYMEGATS